jgi:hypothetical protein
VKLVGYCSEEEHRLLVYEYMPKGSLENHLFKSEYSAFDRQLLHKLSCLLSPLRPIGNINLGLLQYRSTTAYLVQYTSTNPYP